MADNSWIFQIEIDTIGRLYETFELLNILRRNHSLYKVVGRKVYKVSNIHGTHFTVSIFEFQKNEVHFTFPAYKIHKLRPMYPPQLYNARL